MKLKAKALTHSFHAQRIYFKSSVSFAIVSAGKMSFRMHDIFNIY